MSFLTSAPAAARDRNNFLRRCIQIKRLSSLIIQLSISHYLIPSVNEMKSRAIRSLNQTLSARIYQFIIVAISAVCCEKWRGQPTV